MNIEQIILLSLDNCTSLELSHNNHILPLMCRNGKWEVMYGNPFIIEGEFFLEILRMGKRKIEFQGKLFTPNKFTDVLYDSIVKFENLKKTLYFGIGSEVFAVKTSTEFESIMRYIQLNKVEFSISVGEPLPSGVSENQLEFGFPQPQIESDFNFEYGNENQLWRFWRENGVTTVKMFTHMFIRRKDNYKGHLKLNINSIDLPVLDKFCLLDLIAYFRNLYKVEIMADTWTEYNSNLSYFNRIGDKIEKIIQKNTVKSLVVSE